MSKSKEEIVSDLVIDSLFLYREMKQSEDPLQKLQQQQQIYENALQISLIQNKPTRDILQEIVHRYYSIIPQDDEDE